MELFASLENVSNRWILFEAGAVSKTVSESFIVLFLFECSFSADDYPLSQFQGAIANKEGTLSLLRSINSSQESPISPKELNTTFSKRWKDLKTKLKIIPPIKFLRDEDTFSFNYQFNHNSAWETEQLRWPNFHGHKIP